MEFIMEKEKKCVATWAAEKVKKRSEIRRECLQYSVQFFLIFHQSHSQFFFQFKGKCLSQLILFMPFPINDAHLHTHTHTHLYVCDLQSAILHQGHSWFISLKSLSILLPWNLDGGPSDYTTVQLHHGTQRYSLIGRALANNRRDTTWRTYQFEGRGGRMLY